MIRITSKKDGFRRAGLAHPAQATDYHDDKFAPEQLAALEAEPMLVVVRLPNPEPPEAPAPAEPEASAPPVEEKAGKGPGRK